MMVADLPLVDCDALPSQLPASPTELPLTGQRGIAVAMPRMSVLYPEYMNDLSILKCHADESVDVTRIQTDAGDSIAHIPCAQPDRGAKATGHSYFYTGFQISGKSATRETAYLFEQISALLREGDWTSAEAMVNADLQLSDELAKAMQAPEPVIDRLRPSPTHFIVTDLNDAKLKAWIDSEIWVMHDVLRDTPESFSHQPAGCNVLYKDGHVEFLRFTGTSADIALVSPAIRDAYELLSSAH